MSCFLPESDRSTSRRTGLYLPLPIHLLPRRPILHIKPLYLLLARARGKTLLRILPPLEHHPAQYHLLHFCVPLLFLVLILPHPHTPKGAQGLPRRGSRNGRYRLRVDAGRIPAPA